MSVPAAPVEPFEGSGRPGRPEESTGHTSGDLGGGTGGPNGSGRASDREGWRGRLARADALWWPTLLTAGFACLVTFLAKGGLELESLTNTEIVLTLAGGVAGVCGVLFTPAVRSLVEGRKDGLWSLGLLVCFTALAGLSVVWSVQPDASYLEAARLLAYIAVFGAGMGLVRLAPDHWPAILGGLALGATVVCGYALTTKVFPGLAPLITYARLEEPYGYWNAIGLTAAMGAICCMWLGGRRSGHGLVSALAYPAMGILLVTLMLAYSRGALVALAIGLVVWFCIVPIRLRGAAVLIVGGLGAGAVVAFDFTRHALTTDDVALAVRASAGHQLGVLLVVMALVLTLVGVAIGFFTGRRAPSQVARRRAGAVLLAAIVFGVVAFAAALAHSERGFTGSISHAVGDLTNPNAKPPPNSPGRLTAVASVRARYWNQALQIFDTHPGLGAGAGGYETASLRYRTAPLEVKHAHGFLVQTLADLGAAGLALVLGLLLAWLAAAGRATHPFNRSWQDWGEWLRLRSGGTPGWRALEEPALRRYTAERVGLLSMVCLVVVFGVSSFVDWTWYVPGNACVALLCAGWLAGRGPLNAPQEGRRARIPGELGPLRMGVAMAIAIGALLAAWTQWQPQRAVDASQEALALVARDPQAALGKAQTAVSRDPLSAQALFTLAAVEQAAGKQAAALATLQKAVSKQPSNPQTWLTLGRYELTRNPATAVKALQAAIYLNPETISTEAIADGNAEAIEVRNDYIEALRAQQRHAAAALHRAGHVPRGHTQAGAHARAGTPKTKATTRAAHKALTPTATSVLVRRRRIERLARRAARRGEIRALLESRARGGGR
jgi:O-antigen ligase